ncbi:MAG: oligosaccharide flippase family protein [Nitrococcus sp.]|nr:oligosaccharide flippase family protein [Nitrococcus sp.]
MANGITDPGSPVMPVSSRLLRNWRRLTARYWGMDAGSTALRKGATGAFGVQAGAAGLGMIAHMVLARLLGAEQYGSYVLTLTWIGLLLIPALLGQDKSVVRFLSGYVYRGEWSLARGSLRGIRAMVLVSSGAVALLGATLTYLLRSSLGAILEQSLLIGFVLLPILAQLQLSGALHRALKRPISSGLFNEILRPVALLVVVLGLWFMLHLQITAALAIGASALAALIALILSSWLLAHVWPPEAKAVRPAYEFRAWSKVGMNMFLGGALDLTVARLDVLVIGALAGSAAVGPYYAAVQLARLAGYAGDAVRTNLGPMIAERYGAGEHEVVKELAHRAAWLTFTVVVPIVTLLAASGYWLLSLFGPAFTVAYVPLLILLAGRCLAATGGQPGTLMTMTRFEREVVFIRGGAAVLNLLLCLLLIPLLGTIGVAIGTAAHFIAVRFCSAIFVRRRTNINTTIFSSGAV